MKLVKRIIHKRVDYKIIKPGLRRYRNEVGEERHRMKIGAQVNRKVKRIIAAQVEDTVKSIVTTK